MKIFFLILIVLLFFTVLNCASLAYSIDENSGGVVTEPVTTPVIDLNQTTKDISDSIHNVVDNVLKSFSSDGEINIKNEPNNIPTIQTNISSGEVVNGVADMIRLSINLLFATISIVVEILKTLAGSLNDY